MRLPGLDNYVPTAQELELVQLMSQPAKESTIALRAHRAREREYGYRALRAREQRRDLTRSLAMWSAVKLHAKCRDRLTSAFAVTFEALSRVVP